MYLYMINTLFYVSIHNIHSVLCINIIKDKLEFIQMLPPNILGRGRTMRNLVALTVYSLFISFKFSNLNYICKMFMLCKHSCFL